MPEREIPLSVPCLRGKIKDYLLDCINSNFVSSVGPFVERFENEFANYVGSPYAVACVSGTAALHVALKVAGVVPGDEVLVSDFTFIASVNPISYLGARPILVDADEATWNMDPLLVAEELTWRAAHGLGMPKVLLVAHVLGLPADLPALLETCQKHGVIVIEDAAETLGGRYVSGALKGKHVGAIGRLGCYSFNGNKIMTTGGGGMITTADESLAQRARHLTTQARLPGPDYFHDEIGFNYRLTNLAAAVGVSQLEELAYFLEKKLHIARRYDEALAELPGFTLQPRPRWSQPTRWLYSLLVSPQISGFDSKHLQTHLESNNIQCRPLWVPAHKMPFYKDAQCLGDKTGELLHERGISLPCSAGLSDEEQDRVIGTIRDFLT